MVRRQACDSSNRKHHHDQGSVNAAVRAAGQHVHVLVERGNVGNSLIVARLRRLLCWTGPTNEFALNKKDLLIKRSKRKMFSGLSLKKGPSAGALRFQLPSWRPDVGVNCRLLRKPH